MTPKEEATLQAYNLGAKLAHAHMEKTAFLGAAWKAGKFLAGMGNLGTKGSRLAGISAHHVGMPLGFGAMNAAMAEEGQRTEAFVKGVAGGAAFNFAMPLGGYIGKRLLAPAFRGKGALKVMRSIGFGDDAINLMGASRNLNQPMHGTIRALERRLGAGTASKADLSDMFKRVFKNTSSAGGSKALGTDAKKTYDQLQDMHMMFRKGSITPEQQSQLQGLYSTFSKQLKAQGMGMGTRGQQMALKGIGAGKFIGSMGGGMFLGMQADHAIQDAMTTHPASVFDATGGH
jgi:hypothetical protein